MLTCCTATPPTERRLVGTWVSRASGATPEDVNARPRPGDATAKFIYYPDHTYVASRSDQKATVAGTWRIEGDYLVERVNGTSKEQRTGILRLSKTKLIFIGFEGSEGHWWRLGTF